MKKFMSFVLVFVIFCTAVPLNALAAEKDGATVRTENDQIQVSGTNAVGKVLADALQGSENEDEKANVSSVSIEGVTATVSFVSDVKTQVLVALYDENDDSSMLAYGKADAEAEIDEVTVTLNVQTLPEYYLLRVFLLGENNSPLCKAYETKEYTKWFHDNIEVKTTADFNEELTINLDNDETNNFLVLDEGTIKVIAGTNTNTLIENNNETGALVIGNADSVVKGLAAGDLLYYVFGTGDTDYTVIKIGSVSVDGDTVTLVSAEAETEEVFDFVKINSNADSLSSSVNGDYDGVTYLGREPYNTPDPAPAKVNKVGAAKGIDFDESFAVKDKFSIYKETANKRGKVSASLSFSFTFNVKFYHSGSYTMAEATLKQSAAISVELKATAKLEIPFAYYAFSPVPGMYISFEPSFVVEFTATITLSGELTAKVGYGWNSDDGFYNASSKPSFKAEVKIEGKLFIGISFKPKIAIISEKLLNLSMKATFGAEISAKKCYKSDDMHNTDKIHECELCLEGEIKAVLTLSASVKVITIVDKSHDFVSWSVHLFDFYYSFDYNEFAFTTCPHIKYKVTFTVKDKDNNPVAGASVAANGFPALLTDANGGASGYYPNGTYSFSVTKADYKKGEKSLTVLDGAKQVAVILFPADNIGGNVGDIIEFGSYPQTRVTDSATLTALNALSKTWISYGYYSGTGEFGTMTQSDYMKYADVTYSGNKYRAVTFSAYRPYYTFGTSSSTYQDDNGYSTNTVYWFKYEPIEWRVLDPATELVLCETIIDSQAYSDTMYGSDPYYNNSAKTIYATDYETSSIRAWLNDDFYNTAFSAAQQANILSVNRENTAYISTSYNSNNTTDKVFMLSWNEAQNTAYGFTSNISQTPTRYAQGSDYAKSQGLYVYT